MKIELLQVIGFGLGLLSVLNSHFIAAQEWTWRNPLPQGHTLSAVTFGGGVFVAVGEHGTILTSSDASNWSIQASGTREPLRGVVYGNGQFVAVGGSSFTPTILTSQDGVTWNKQSTDESKALYAIAHGAGIFVAVGEGARSLLTSRDGVSWRSASNSGYTFSDTFEAVASGVNGFIAVGTGGAIIRSPDGRNWEKQVPDASAHFRGVTESARGVVAVGKSGAVLVSADGSNWVRKDAGTSRDLTAIREGNGIYVAVGAGGAILTSIDGSGWTLPVSGTDRDLTSIAFGNGRWVAVGNAGVILGSTDGMGWGRLDSGGRADVFGAAHGNGLYVAVGAAGAVYTSRDGRSWTIKSAGVSTDLYGVTFGQGLFVAAGANGTILVSPDANEWVKVPGGTSLDLWDIEFGGGVFVAVGGQGLVTSTDAIQWTRRAVGEYKLLGAGYGNGQFVAVGEPLFARIGAVVGNSPILTSTDGVSWIERDSGTLDALLDVTFAAGKFVAVGRAAALSNDGQNWKLESGPAALLRGVTASGGKFLAVGDSGTIVNSTDGSSWAEMESGTGQTLNRVVSVNGKVLAVGNAGTILELGVAGGRTSGLTITPNVVTNDYIGKIRFTIEGLTPGQSVAVDTFLDENGNGQLDGGEQFVNRVTITDGQLPIIDGVRNLNVPGDEDAAADGVIRTDLDLSRRTETDGIAGNYLFQVTGDKFGPVRAPLSILPLKYPQGTAGTVVAADNGGAVPGALVALFDIDSGKVSGNGFTDSTGRFELFTLPGSYVLVAARPGFVFDLATGEAAMEAIANPGLLVVPPNQFIQRNLALNRGARSVRGTLRDSVTGEGIPGLQFFGLGLGVTPPSTNMTASLSFAYTDVSGDINMPVSAGMWYLAGLPKLAARLGYLVPDEVAPFNTSTGNVERVDVKLPKASALVHGTVRNERGEPIVGIQISASGESGLRTATATDASGRFTLGVREGLWSIDFDSDELNRLGYETTEFELRLDPEKAKLQEIVLKRVNRLPGPVVVVTRTGSNVALAWPANATGFVLESAPRLPSAEWTRVTTPPTVIGLQQVVLETINSSQKFYRLREAR